MSLEEISGHAHVGVFKIIKELQNEQKQVQLHVESILRGAPRSLQRKQDRKREDRIQTVYNDRENRELTQQIPASPLCTGQEQFGLSADEDDGHRLYEFSIRCRMLCDFIFSKYFCEDQLSPFQFTIFSASTVKNLIVIEQWADSCDRRVPVRKLPKRNIHVIVEPPMSTVTSSHKQELLGRIASLE
ncbi:15847_t:CDS:2 [Funneliformis caledonium]|uniref:15847_t:CDS:1 n=1 Tax=Funneliformis caledonium TaxID=1117310 RepID=A0A9N9BZZ0_9GLOM|nr:15847_t:CDS:2 [Funneliformis caledonium]